MNSVEQVVNFLIKYKLRLCTAGVLHRWADLVAGGGGFR
jgi:hypothetical protein